MTTFRTPMYPVTDEEAEEYRQEDISRWTEAAGEPLDHAHWHEPLSLHEALDRACVVSEIWEEHVRTHPVVLLNPTIHRAAMEATQLMEEVYQRIGQLTVDAPPTITLTQDDLLDALREATSGALTPSEILARLKERK